MKSTEQRIVGVMFVIGVLFLASLFFNQSYTPPDNETIAPQITLPANKIQLPITCTIIVPETILKSGSEIPGINVGAAPSPLSLQRPIGEMLSDSMVATAGYYFSDVRLASRIEDVQGSDLIINLISWRFGTEDKDTGYNFVGLPMLVASGDAYTTLYVEMQVSGPNIPLFIITESAKGTQHLNLALFPISRLSLSMTESSDLAAAAVSKKVFDQIIQNSSLP